MCLNCEDMAQQSCAMVRRWRIFGDFLRPAFPASRVQHVSDLHPKFALGRTMLCGSMVDIQSATAENRRRKKDGRRRYKIEETTGQKYNVRVCYTGRP